MDNQLHSQVLGDPSNRLVSEKEAAQLLCISVAWLRRRRLHGEAPEYVKLGRHVRYETSVLKDFFQARRIGTKETLGKK